MILVFAFLIIRDNVHKIPEKKLYFTPEPVTWIEENDLTNNEDDNMINVMKATEGKSEFSANRLSYFDKGTQTAFFYHGYYKGNYFDAVYLDPEFYNLDSRVLRNEEIENLTQKYKKIEVSQYLDPTDGIMQVFILAKKDPSGYVFYLFVDQDWKNGLGITNIIYGNDFNDKTTLIEKLFDFQEIKPGIYMDKIDDHNSWYDENPINGGIMLGEIRISDLSKTEVNSTFIILR